MTIRTSTSSWKPSLEVTLSWLNWKNETAPPVSVRYG